MYIIPPHGASCSSAIAVFVLEAERKGFTSASCSRDSQARLTHSSASYSIMWTLGWTTTFATEAEHPTLLFLVHATPTHDWDT